MKIKIMIIDDEQLAIEIIEKYLAELPNIEIVAKCNTTLEAFEKIHLLEPDLIFLDIQMPKLTGLELIKSLKNPPKIIITTAHRKYALEGYELDIVDYLLKPISFERFLKAINKFYQITNIQSETTKATIISKSSNDDFIYVKENRKLVKIYLNEILFIESLKDYIIIHTDQNKIITKEKISSFEKKLPNEKFIRIHRSYIISILRIKSLTPISIQIGKKDIAIGKIYKNSVLRALNYFQK